MENLDVDKFVSGFSYMILRHINLTPSMLEETDSSFKNLSRNEWNKLLTEILLYDLHCCDRLLFGWYGPEKREGLMDGIIIQLAQVVDTYRERILDEKLNTLTLESFTDYLKTLQELPTPEWLKNTYNQRQIEYGNYKFLTELKRGSGLAGYLPWEFGKKIASLIGREYDIRINLLVSLLTKNFIKLMAEIKKVLDNSRSVT